jgi:hypothetical protein
MTATFRLLYVLVVIEHRSRRLIHCNITAHPSATWTLQQLREAIGLQDRYKYLLHDRDSIFAKHLDESIIKLGVQVLKSPPRRVPRPCAGAPYCNGESTISESTVNVIPRVESARCPGSADGNALQLQFQIPTSPARGYYRARERRVGWSPP